MRKETALNIISNILLLIEEHNQKHVYHANSCEFLTGRYIKLEQALLHNTDDLIELLEWNKWFAPRIIYEGIGDKDLLCEIEKLDIILSDELS